MPIRLAIVDKKPRDVTRRMGRGSHGSGIVCDDPACLKEQCLIAHGKQLRAATPAPPDVAPLIARLGRRAEWERGTRDPSPEVIALCEHAAAALAALAQERDKARWANSLYLNRAERAEREREHILGHLRDMCVRGDRKTCADRVIDAIDAARKGKI
jgi:hypothetical protein